jgi:hypothetical protein
LNRIIDSRTVKLSLAVSLIDDFTKKTPLGSVKVSLKDRKHEAIKNLSGYYVFLDLPDETYTVQVKSDFYFDENVDATLSSLDSRNPVKEIWLTPKPSYPFPPGATLVRGTVYDTSQKTVPDAVVQISEKNLKNATSEKGEFVLYFRPLKESEIVRDNGKRFVKGQAGKRIRIKATKNGRLGEEDIEIEEGSTNIIYIHLT